MKSRIKYKSVRTVLLKTGSYISCAKTDIDTYHIVAHPAKRKHNKPQPGMLHLTETSALVLLTELLFEFGLENDEILDKLGKKLDNKLVIPEL